MREQYEDAAFGEMLAFVDKTSYGIYDKNGHRQKESEFPQGIETDSIREPAWVFVLRRG